MENEKMLEAIKILADEREKFTDFVKSVGDFDDISPTLVSYWCSGVSMLIKCKRNGFKLTVAAEYREDGAHNVTYWVARDNPRFNECPPFYTDNDTLEELKALILKLTPKDHQ